MSVRARSGAAREGDDTAPGPDLGAVPADAPRPPVPAATWPAGKEPDFVAWMHQISARRLTVERDRTTDLDVAPRPGELRAYPIAPSEAYVMVNGWDEVVTAELVPDRLCPLLREALWTCILAGAGYEVFGNWPGDLCPAKACWSGRSTGT